MSEAKGLLALRLERMPSAEQHERVSALLEPIAQALGVKAMILGPGAEAELKYDHSPQLDRICVLLEELVEQGRPAEAVTARQANHLIQPNGPYTLG